MKHKHCELIKAWADGAQIECLDTDGKWYYCASPGWHENICYRVKPELKWYDNIPENGVLCLASNEPIVEYDSFCSGYIVNIIEYDEERNRFVTDNYARVEYQYVRPLTKEEIQTLFIDTIN